MKKYIMHPGTIIVCFKMLVDLRRQIVASILSYLSPVYKGTFLSNFQHETPVNSTPRVMINPLPPPTVSLPRWIEHIWIKPKTFHQRDSALVGPSPTMTFPFQSAGVGFAWSSFRKSKYLLTLLFRRSFCPTLLVFLTCMRREMFVWKTLSGAIYYERLGREIKGCSHNSKDRGRIPNNIIVLCDTKTIMNNIHKQLY